MSRGLARLGAGLALVAVASCGSIDDTAPPGKRVELNQYSAAGPMPAPPVVRAPVEVSLTQPDPTRSPAQTESQAPAENSAPAEGPARESSDGWGLRIPAIGVDTPVVSLTMTADRALVPPSDPGLVGWWSQGAGPGDGEGSVVIVGHSVSTGGGVFDDVDMLGKDDVVHIEHLEYRVQSVEVMSKSDLAHRAGEIFDQTVPERLVLVTCEGWDGETWRSNAVAIATPA